MLSEKDKYLIGIGLNLANDILGSGKTQNEKFAIIAQIAKIVEKLDMSKEFGKAAASTAAIGNVLRQSNIQLMT